MVLKHIHDTNMRARGEPERVFTVSAHQAQLLPAAAAVLPPVTAQCLPLQVNRIKIPKQLDELVEMQNESASPVLKVFSKIRAEFRGVRHHLLVFLCFTSG